MERAFHLAQAGRPGPVLVDVPMDIFSADLPVDAFRHVPAIMSRPTVDAATVVQIVDALASAERPILYAGGGVLSARATAELAALAEALEVPVAHTLMGKGCLRDDHPLLLGQSGLESMHYGWSFGCMSERCGEPYHVDYAGMARACGARGVNIESAAALGPALDAALASALPTVIQVAMENAPTPTPGHWDINDIYRKGE